MKLTTILALTLLVFSGCRHGKTGKPGEPGQNGIGQDGTNGQDGTDGLDGTPASRVIVVRGIDGLHLPDYVSVSDALPSDLEDLGAIAGEEGLLIITDVGLYAVRTRGDFLVVLRSDEEGDLPGGEIFNSPTCLLVGEIVIFCDEEDDDGKKCKKSKKSKK